MGRVFQGNLRDMVQVYRGDGWDIGKTDGTLWISCEEGITGRIVYYEITEELAAKAMRSNEDSYEVIMFAQTGAWPPSEAERQEMNREFLRKLPKLLLVNPENQRLFDPDELKELLEKAERQL